MDNVNNLISKLGDVMQLAFVPKDVQAELRYWTETMGVGPFYLLDHIQTIRTLYRGENANIDFSVYIGYWGDIQIEIIEQHNDTPSIYKSWLDENREGLHHVCVVVEDIKKARQICVDAGIQIEQEVDLVGGGGAIYVDAGGGQGHMVELIQLMPEGLAYFDVMKAAARSWDGTNPIIKAGE
ncbi:VOC family protein [Paraburkholderia sp. BR14374]|uniref:VOC family protein n=1 Tax=Paraburkholderia sp. BR14374 TaxID=3237007 RepID=UPI0034CDE696